MRADTLHPSLRFFRHPRQREHAVLPPPILSHRSLHRAAFGSENPAHRPQNFTSVSRPAAADSLLRCGKKLPLIFLTNNFFLPAFIITQLYRSRWQVELFFRWIKQHLRIKAFYGTSQNAVKTQVWVAISAYLLVLIMKKQLGLDLSPYQILQILRVTIFEKTPILRAFSDFDHQQQDDDLRIQLPLFDL
jgi:hypothetical protein